MQVKYNSNNNNFSFKSNKINNHQTKMQSPKFQKFQKTNQHQPNYYSKTKYLSQQKEKFLKFFKLQSKIEPLIKVFQLQEKQQKQVKKRKSIVNVNVNGNANLNVNNNVNMSLNNINKKNKTIKFSRNVQTALPNDFFLNSKSQRCNSMNNKVTTLQVSPLNIPTQSSKSINVRGISKIHHFKHYNNINTLQSENQFFGHASKQTIRYRQKENSQQAERSDLDIKILGNFKNMNQKLGFDFIREGNRNKKVLSCRTSVGKSKQFYENLKKNKYFQQEQKSAQFKILPKTAQTAQTYSPQKQKQDNLCNLTFGNNFRQAFQKKINSQQLNTNKQLNNNIPQIIQQNLGRNQFIDQSIKNRYQFTSNSKYQFKQITDTLPIKKHKHLNHTKNSTTRDKLLLLSKFDCQINSQNIIKTKINQINLMKTLQIKEQKTQNIRKIKLPKLQ